MALATMDDELYKKVQQFTEKNDVDYPTASYFINQAVKEKLLKEGVYCS